MELDFTGLTTGLTAAMGDALPVILAVVGGVMAINLGISLVKRFAR